MTPARLAVPPEVAAEMLSITPTYLKWLIRSGKLRAVRLGHRTLRVPVSEIERLLSSGS